MCVGAGMSSSRIRVGIIGMGGMGSEHALNISEMSNAVVTMLSDVDEQRMQVLRDRIDGVCCVSDPYLLIESDTVDAIVIASPDDTHAAYVLRSLELMKPVFCEKPLATGIADALHIIEAETHIGSKMVSLGFNRHFDPAHYAMKRSIEKRVAGKPLLWKGYHRNAEAMYTTDGAFLLNNSGGHDVDSARWLLESEVSAVHAWGIRSRDDLPPGSQDLLCMTLEMENGTRALAEIFVNARYGYEVGAEVVCQEGVVTLPLRESLVIRNANTRSVVISDDFRAYFSSSYKQEIRAWVGAVQSKVPWQGADAWDGYAVMATTQAAGRSLKHGKVEPISLISCPELYGR
mgnify:CR=1 FL=1